MKKYVYFFLGLIMGLILAGTNIIYSYPTSEEINIQMFKLCNNVGNLLHKKITPIYQLVDGQLIENAWDNVVENLKELNSILDKELYER